MSRKGKHPWSRHESSESFEVDEEISCFALGGALCQFFYFHREVDQHGTPIPQDNSFHQNQYPDTTSTAIKLIPIIKGAGNWTFRIASPIRVYRSLVPSGDDYVAVPKPLTITYDPTSDFSVVSERLAAEYAAAFIAINDNLQVTPVEVGNGQVAYKYWQGTATPPSVIFPALSFTANTTVDVANTTVSTATMLYTFTGFQGVYIERTGIDPDDPEDDPGYDYYLPFAFIRQMPGCKHWISISIKG